MSAPVEYRILLTKQPVLFFDTSETPLAEQVLCFHLANRGLEGHVEGGALLAYLNGKVLTYSAAEVEQALRDVGMDLVDVMYPDAATLFSSLAELDGYVVHARARPDGEWAVWPPAQSTTEQQSPRVELAGAAAAAASSSAYVDDAPSGPVAEMRAVMSTIDRPGRGEAALHLRRHVGYALEQTVACLNDLFYPIPEGARDFRPGCLDTRLVLGDVRNGKKRMMGGRPCRYCRVSSTS